MFNAVLYIYIYIYIYQFTTSMVPIVNSHYFLSMKQLIFIIMECGVLFEVQNEFLNII
jgi:hypothetical protein